MAFARMVSYILQQPVQIVKLFYENMSSVDNIYSKLSENDGQHNRPLENNIYLMVKKI